MLLHNNHNHGRGVSLSDLVRQTAATKKKRKKSMFKRILRNWLFPDHECYPQPASPDTGSRIREMTDYLNYAFAVYPIEGGYLIRTEKQNSSNHQPSVAVAFVPTAEGITKHIIAKHALHKLGGS